MPTRIDKLTPAQESRFEEWRERWIAIGLQIGETDWEGFEKGARECYRFAKLDQPQVIVHVSSPLVVAFAAPIASHLLRNAVAVAVGDAVHVAVRDAVGDAVHVAVRDAVGDAVRDAVRDAVGDAVRDAVGDAVHSAVHVAVRDAVGDAVHVAVRDAVRNAVGVAVHVAVRDAVGNAVGVAVSVAVSGMWMNYIGGQFWVGGGWWYGSPTMASFFRDVCKLEISGDIWDRALAYELTARSAGWWWPHRDFIMVSARPTAIHRDARGRLHNLNRAAIEWPDGWGVYSIHGVRVPKQYILTPAEQIDSAEVLKEANAQVRMAVISKLGFARMLGKLPHKIVSTGPNPRHPEKKNELIEFRLGEIPVRGLHVFWKERGGDEKETVILVWRTREEFRRLSGEAPENVNDAEQVRRWVMRLPKDVELVEEI